MEGSVRLILCLLYLTIIDVTVADRSVVTTCESGEIDSGFCDPRDTQVTMANCFNYKRYCAFATPFLSPPAVTYGITAMDTDKAHNVRLAALGRSTTHGLSMEFLCWADSWCYNAKVSWMACGLTSV